MHKIYFHPCNLVYFYYSCHSAFPIYSLLADLPALLLKMIENPAASDHSTTPTLVPASVFSNRGDFHNIPRKQGSPASHRMQDTIRIPDQGLSTWQDLASARLTDLRPSHSMLSCSVLVILVSLGLRYARFLPRDLCAGCFSASGMLFAQVVSWLTLPSYSGLRGFPNCLK